MRSKFGELEEAHHLARLHLPPPPKLLAYVGAGISLLISIGVSVAAAVSVESYSMGSRSWLLFGFSGLYLAAGIVILLLGLEQRRQYIAVMLNYGSELLARRDHGAERDVRGVADGLFSAGAYREAFDLAQELRAAEAE
ncbi:hypothetical protein ACFU6S_44930 [Streptomyces sp. NPDC057456]|uniref:hypothetical protein n=1 Tax=Streptomyces sp. NPDC057456 TaxID=3346139 RepID=UPI0036BAE37D